MQNCVKDFCKCLENYKHKKRHRIEQKSGANYFILLFNIDQKGEIKSIRQRLKQFLDKIYFFAP